MEDAAGAARPPGRPRVEARETRGRSVGSASPRALVDHDAADALGTERRWGGAGARVAVRRWSSVALTAVVLVVCCYVVLAWTPEQWVDHTGRKSASRRWRLSTALADAALAFLAVTLAYGPLRTLAGARPAVHLPARRALGITAAVLGVGHLVVGLSIHGSWREPWRSFVTAWPSLADPFPVVGGARGLANWLGLGLAVLLVSLAVISSRSWMRRLGRRRWKLVQRSAYLAVVGVGLHALLYWRVERRLVLHQAIVVTVLALVAALQLAGVLNVRRRRARSSAGT